MTDEVKARCSICKRPLDSPSDPKSLDCGGDCLRCMALIAEDPDCMSSYIKTQAREIERLREAVRFYVSNCPECQGSGYHKVRLSDCEFCSPARAALAGDSHDQ